MGIIAKKLSLSLRAICCLLSLSCITPSFAKTFALPNAGETIIGKTKFISSVSGESLVTIAQKYDVGLNEIVDANAGINPRQTLTPGTKVHIPTAFLMPRLPKKGIIINLPEMRMYYFPAKANGIVMTYPIGIGKVGKTIPIQRTAVLGKRMHPTWTPPQDIREFNEQQGIILPQVMPAGPDNPLGPYAIYLKIPTFLIHSTIYPDSVGRRASFGCIRMHEDDIKEFYPLISSNTPVTIVDMPNKLGWQDNKLYLETHDPLEEHQHEDYAGEKGITKSIMQLSKKAQVLVDWPLVSYLADDPDGLPHEVGFKVTN